MMCTVEKPKENYEEVLEYIFNDSIPPQCDDESLERAKKFVNYYLCEKGYL